MLYQPTCVGFGTGARDLPSGFSWAPPRPASPMRFAGWPGRVGGRACLPPPGRHRTGASRTRPGLVGAVPASVGSGRARRRNVCLPPLAYGSRPRLRPRLTLGGRAFPRKPRASGGVDSHHALATRASILAPARSTQPRRLRFPARGTLPYRWGPQAPSRRFGASLSPVNCRRAPTRPVSCYALFGRVAASGPTSWLSWKAHILCHSAMTWGPWRAVWAVPLSGAELSSRVLTPRPWPACVRSSVPFGRLRRPLGDPVALPPAGCPAGQP